jgi:uncharacterized RDD family membrane protein YckC
LSGIGDATNNLEAKEDQMAWYYHQNGENKGPLEVEELRNLRQGNAIADDTLVWQEGMPQWIAYSTTSAAVVPATVPVGAGYDMQTCVECGKSFPQGEMVNFEGKSICPTCKPLFFQRLREGVVQPGILHYARVLVRFCAIFLDGILIDIVVLVPMMLIYGVAVVTPAGRGEIPAGLNVLFLTVQYLLPPLYEIIMVGRFGATLGKMALKVKVVNADGSPISYAKSTGRYFAKILSGIILCIGYMMAIWDPEKRALHDRICNTRVIKTGI